VGNREAGSRTRHRSGPPLWPHFAALNISSPIADELLDSFPSTVY